MTNDGGHVVVQERVMVRKFPDATAHARDEAEAVVVVDVTTVDGTETERGVAEIGRDDPSFARVNAAAVQREAAYRQQEDEHHGTE